MWAILMALLTFLVGCLALCVIIYVSNLILDMIVLPPPVKSIALVLIGLIFLVLLILLCLVVAQSAGGINVHFDHPR
jgi:hypothetical protein